MRFSYKFWARISFLLKNSLSIFPVEYVKSLRYPNPFCVVKRYEKG